MSKHKEATPQRLLVSIGLLAAVAMGLLLFRLLVSDSLRFVFLGWNLALAALAPLLAAWLVGRIRQLGWWGWQQVLLAVLWLSFLPNSFYIITDLVHIRPTYEMPLMYDIVMLSSFMLSGLVLGYQSLYLVHNLLLSKLKPSRAYQVVGLVLLLCSFAMYLGRYGRWNSWDIVMNPAGLVFDVSDRFVNPAAHEQTYLLTLTVFALLFSLYGVIFEAANWLRRK